MYVHCIHYTMYNVHNVHCTLYSVHCTPIHTHTHTQHTHTYIYIYIYCYINEANILINLMLIIVLRY